MNFVQKDVCLVSLDGASEAFLAFVPFSIDGAAELI